MGRFTDGGGCFLTFFWERAMAFIGVLTPVVLGG